ncbi:efflux RND transporter periplasmic adaptor subunit [Negadavirga shengliensis]|uniref:Efflux RND transporter periplasmic adaptor subunit n=1 Tax=Negadavirga shengliensis TaxID=1389218 RepID=A0ABV9T1Q7_9BACT
MKKHINKFFVIALIFLAYACGQQGDEVELKKRELEGYKKEAASLKLKIQDLEAEIAHLDPEFGKSQRKSVLISTLKPRKGGFEHYVEVTGSVLSKRNVNISAEVSGRIQEIVAIEGMSVKKGEVLAIVDAEAVNRNLDEVEKQLELARTVFEKQERLWNQQIGTEIQYLEAKNRKETLEKSLAALELQKDRTTVTAPFDGTVEQVMVRVGELVQPGSPIANFIGSSDLFIEGEVSERYVGILKKGDVVNVKFPSLGTELETKITAVGGVIDPNNRTFKIEAFLPRGENIKPNMVSVIRVKDYENSEAVSVPTHLLLQDNEGEYLFTIEDETAHKTYVTRGKTYQGRTEIVEGLTGEELLVDKGFREVGDNFRVSIAQN